MYGGPVIGPDSGPPRYMVPVSEPAGSVATSRLTVPSSEAAGHSTPNASEWILACAGVHAAKPAAADGLSVMPSGMVIDAVLTWDWAFAVGLFGSEASAVISLGWSERVDPEASAKFGSNRTLPQPLSPIGVVNVLAGASLPSRSVTFSDVVLWPGQLVALVMKSPVPMLPLKVRRERISGSSGDTPISK